MVDFKEDIDAEEDDDELEDVVIFFYLQKSWKNSWNWISTYSKLALQQFNFYKIR